MINIPGTPIIEKLQAKCRSILVERTYTPGFTISADQYESLGPFTTALHISYPAGANKTVSIVQVRTVGSDVCVRDVLLDQIGSASAADYNVSDTHMIYAMIRSVVVGGNTIQCCTPLPSGEFDYTNCPTSNYIRFTVTDTGNIQFLSNPSGAHIWLAPTGQTPADTTQTTPGTITSLPVGDYDYILKLTNYNDYISTQPITVIKDQTTIVGPINLVPAQGCIYFSSSPQGARIYIAPVGQTPVDTGLNTPNIICGKPLGDYIFRLVLSGYEDATGTVTLTSGHGEIVTKNLRGLPILSDITISPLNPSITVNTDQQFGATPLDQYNNPYPTTVTWSSSNTYVGTIDPNTGMFSALNTGTSVITASSGSVTKTTTVTVTPLVPILTTITISPATVSIVANNAVIFTATKLDQFNNPIFATVTWSSSNINVGTIDQNGVFLALSQGTTIITASSGTVSGIAVANVTPAIPVEIPVLTTITVSPATVSIVANNAVIFTATKLDQFNNPISATVTWSSSDPIVGTVDQNGVFLAISQGTTIITASSGIVSGVAIANVLPIVPPMPTPVLTRIVITPSTLSIQAGNASVFIASTLDQFGNPFTATVTWTSSNPNIGTIDPDTGVFTAISHGSTVITATSDTIIGIAVANVAPATPPPIVSVLTKIVISPLTLSIVAGNSDIFTVQTLDQYNDPFPTSVIWNSSDLNIGTIDPDTGVFTAISHGSTVITASSGNITGAALVNVALPPTVPVLTTITISPTTVSIMAGNALIFTATTLDQFGNHFPTTITWNSLDTNIGTINQNGIFVAISAGNTIITASNGNISGIAIVNVIPAPVVTPVLTTITILPSTASVMAGNSTVFTVVTLDQYGNPISTTVTWSSSDTNVGTIGQNGVFLAISPGTTIIRVTSDTISGLAIVNVTSSPVLDKIIVSPSTLSISTNNSAIFTAATLDQFGNPISATVAWSSSDTNVGTIEQNGVFTAISPGATTITATSEFISGIAIANVTLLPIILPVLTRIEITPLTTTITAGSNTVFSASTLDQFGNPIFVTVTWTSSDISIGTITQNGVFTAISPGTTTIMASGGNISGVALANVIPVVPTAQPTLANIVITPLTETVLVGTGTVFVVSTLDQFGNSIVTPVTWDSSDPNVGIIDQYGIFSALHTGKTTITVTSGTIVGVALVNVVTTLPGQAAGGVLGNINNAALILGMAMVGAVIVAKPHQPTSPTS